MSDEAIFYDNWPGHRKWLMFDVCSEITELQDMQPVEQTKYCHQSDRIAHWSCDLGLPCISILKHIEPFDLAANSAMAPFAPIRDDTRALGKELLNQALSPNGVSCGWYCGVEDIAPSMSAAVDFFLPRISYRALVYGPEKTGLVPNLARVLSDRGFEVWVVSDGVRKETLALVPLETRLIQFAQVKMTYRKWQGQLFSSQ